MDALTDKSSPVSYVLYRSSLEESEDARARFRFRVEVGAREVRDNVAVERGRLNSDIFHVEEKSSAEAGM